MEIGNQFGSLGKCTESLMWSLDSAMVVRGLVHQLNKSHEVVTTVFAGFEFEVSDDEVRVVDEKLDTSC